MEQIKLSYNEAIFYIAFINILLGFLLGSFPLISGFIAKNRKYGIYGFIGSIIGGAILGILLSYPIALIFTWLTLRKLTDKSSVNVENEKPVDVSINDSEDS